MKVSQQDALVTRWFLCMWKVENPIPFAESALTRVLSTGYLHARYAGLLLAPVLLSADWSFACIPLVDAMADVRNLATAALYSALAWSALACRPGALFLQWTGLGPQAPVDRGTQHARWRAMVCFGLLVSRRDLLQSTGVRYVRLAVDAGTADPTVQQKAFGHNLGEWRVQSDLLHI